MRSLVRNLTKCDHANVLYLHEALVSDFLGRIPFGASKLCHVSDGEALEDQSHLYFMYEQYFCVLSLCPLDLAHLGWKVY